MRRIILSNANKTEQFAVLGTAPKRKTALSEMALDRRLREKRSNRYIEALKALDSGHLAVNSAAYNDLVETIREELPDPDALLGIVAKCYLGDPYEIHTLDIVGCIIEHYPPYKSLEPNLEKARSLARHDDYAFVEVYMFKMVAINHDGSTSIIK